MIERSSRFKSGRAHIIEARVRTENRRIRQHCECGGSDAAQALTYASNGMLVEDVSVCIACGATLWEWTWNSTMVAAKEARAELNGAKASKEKGQASLLFE